MASMNLWDRVLSDASRVVVQWNKLEGWNEGRQYTVDHHTAPHPTTRICNQMMPTRYYATKEGAVRAAQRLVNKLTGGKQPDRYGVPPALQDGVTLRRRSH